MKFRSNFEIKAWDVAESGGVDELGDISRATIRKSFSGELEGSSVGYGLFLQTPEKTGGYVVIERVTANAGGREGTFVIQHYAIRDAEGGGPWYGDVVPGTGSGDMSGITGTFTIEHGESGASFEWDLEFRG
jgi:Protein of unknown function (DUF3224)